MTTQDKFTPVRYYTEFDPYTYVVDNRPLQDIISNLNTAASEIDQVKANLDSHVNDTADAHDASAIRNVPAGNIAATTMQGAINELDTEKAGLSLANTFTQPQTVPNATAAGHVINKSQLDAHINDPVDAHDASAISNIPSGNIAATTMQAAVNELDAEKAGLSLANTFTQPQTVPDATLAAYTQLLATATYVDAILYDTAKDSDGGAWRDRCEHLSWYNEARPSGRFLGRYADRASAIAANPDWTSNDWYARTGSQQFMQLTATAETETFRAGSSKFPARVLVTAESDRVVIYDLTDPQVTMWMVFVGVNMIYSGTSSLAMLNATLLAGSSTTYGNMRAINFLADSAVSYRYNDATNGTTGAWRGNGIAGRNAGQLYDNRTILRIVNETVNDVAITTLPNASIDPATGLPVPTILAGTNGGVSVIKDNGTVVNSAKTGPISKLALAGHNDFLALWSGGESSYYYYDIGGLSAGFDGPKFLNSITAPYINTAGQVQNAVQGLGKQAFVICNPKNAMTFVKQNGTLGLAAYVTSTFNTGHMPGDIRGAWLADTVAETLTAPEMVTNGTFDVDTSGWTDSGSASNLTYSVVGGALDAKLTATTAGESWYPVIYQTFNVVIGKTYLITGTITNVTGASGSIGVYSNGPGGGNIGGAGVGTFSINVTATTNTLSVVPYLGNAAAVGDESTWDNISVKRVDADRSVKNNGLNIIGSLTKAPVAAGAKLVGYSGFDANNYLQQPYSANLDFGTGDFHIGGWVKAVPGDCTILFRGLDLTAGGPANGFNIWVYNANTLKTFIGGVGLNSPSGSITPNYSRIDILRRSGTVYMYINGNLVGSIANANSLTLTGGFTWIGTGYYSSPGHSIALLRVSATAPTAEQIQFMYQQEAPLFQPNAQCTLDGTSNVISALSYDEDTDLLHVGTSWGRSTFHGLTRVASEATTVGSLKAIAAAGGEIAQVGTSGKVYLPAKQLRAELARGPEQAAHFGAVLQPFEFDAVAAQVDFKLPAGWTSVAVYSAGALKREGATKDWVRKFDGFLETVSFAVAPGAGVWVSVLARRA